MSTRRSSRPRPTHLAAGNLVLQRNVSVADLPTDLNSMYVGQLRNWCQSLGLPSTGGRVALQNRLEAKRNTISSPNVSDVKTTSGNTTQQQSLSNVVQLSKDDVQAMINTSVQVAVAEVAKSAIGAYESTRADDDHLNHVTTSTSTAQQCDDLSPAHFPTMFPTIESAAMNFAEVGAQSHQPQLQHQERQELLRSALPKAENGFLSQFATASSYLPAIPAKYIKEIELGEFFMLSKLLPKNLNKLNYEPEHSHNDYMEVVIENNQLKTRKRRPEVITNIEDWTSCFSIYMAVLVQK